MIEHGFLAIVIVSLIGCGGTECTDQSEKVIAAKELNQAQLESFYNEALKLMTSDIVHLLQGEDIPKGFDAVKPDAVRIRTKSVRLYLESCSFDDKVVIFINKEDEGNGKILLRWGEGPQTNTVELWRKP